MIHSHRADCTNEKEQATWACNAGLSCRCVVIQKPLQQLHKDTASYLKQFETVLVAGSSNAQVRQAYIRLTEVFELENVKVIVDS